MRSLLTLPGVLPVIALDGLTSPTVSVSGTSVDASGDIFVSGSFAGGGINLNPDGSTLVSSILYVGFIAKYSPQGAFLWDQSIPGTPGLSSSKISAIALDAQGNPVVTGSQNSDIYVAKLDKTTGQFIWADTFGNSTGSAGGDAIAISSGGSIYITGSFGNSSIGIVGNQPALTRKLYFQGSYSCYAARLSSLSAMA